MASALSKDSSSLDASSLKTNSSSVSESFQSVTFPQFPLFPKELRLSIWKLALPNGRIISVHEIEDQREGRWAFARFVLQQSKLPLLYTCHESRITALQVYQVHQYKQFGQPFFFDPKSDAILFHGVDIMSSCCSDSDGPLKTFSPVNGMTRTLGIALAHRPCDGPFGVETFLGSFWRSVIVSGLKTLMKTFGTLDTLFVYHPLCLGTNLKEVLNAMFEQEKDHLELDRSSGSGGSTEITVPKLVFHCYEDALDPQETEAGLRKLMEEQKFWGL